MADNSGQFQLNNSSSSGFLHLCCPLLPVSRRACGGEGHRVAVVDAAHLLLSDDVENPII